MKFILKVIVATFTVLICIVVFTLIGFRSCLYILPFPAGKHVPAYSTRQPVAKTAEEPGRTFAQDGAEWLAKEQQRQAELDRLSLEATRAWGDKEYQLEYKDVITGKAMAVNFKVIDVRRIPSAEPSRIGKLDYLVTYQLDPMRVYIVTIAQDVLTESIIKEAIRKDLEAMQAWTGKEFTL